MQRSRLRWLDGTGWFASPRVIFEDDRMQSNDQLVLLYICRHAGSDGTAWPSLDTIAEKTKLARRTVLYSIARLQHLGWLQVVQQSRKGHRGARASVYIVCVQDGHTTTPRHVAAIKVHQVHRAPTDQSANGDDQSANAAPIKVQRKSVKRSQGAGFGSEVVKNEVEIIKASRKSFSPPPKIEGNTLKEILKDMRERGIQ